MEKIAFGSDWSNRVKSGKTFKNIASKDPFRIPAWGLLKFTFSHAVHPSKPQGGYKAFGEMWHKPCHMGEKLAQLRSDPETAMSDFAFWIGHASSLLCLRSGTNILFDPIFSKRCSPFSFAGPARRFPPATTVDQLPHIDIVTISHNHYDHLDKASVVALHRRFPDITFVVPLRMETLLLPWGIPASSILSVDWWDEVHVKDVVIGCTPAQHWGKHSLCDTNHVLWCGWCVAWGEKGTSLPMLSRDSSPIHVPEEETPPCSEAVSNEVIPPTATIDWSQAKTFFFTGDTAFNENIVRAMHKRFPRIDMAALPIGAYSPREFMKRQHIDPQSAVRILELLQVKQAYAVHWATFELANETIDEPPKELESALKDANVAPGRFRAIPTGTYLQF